MLSTTLTTTATPTLTETTTTKNDFIYFTKMNYYLI